MNSNFVKNGEFGKSLSKVWQKLKQDDRRRMSLIEGSYENATSCVTNNFFQKSIKGLANFKWELKKRASCANSDYRKVADLDNKGKFRQKYRVCQKFIKGLAKYSNELTKRDKFGKKLSKVWQKVDYRDATKGHFDKWRL